MTTLLKLGRFSHLLGCAPDDTLPLANKTEEAIKSAWSAASRATFVRAQKGAKRPWDDVDIKTGVAAKNWLSVLDFGCESGQVTHSDFETLNKEMKQERCRGCASAI